MRRISPGAASWLFISKAAELSATDRQLVDELCNHERLSSLYSLTQRFAQMLRSKDKSENSRGLAGWIADASTSGISEMARFANGLTQDIAAVEAALSQPWSNGPVEGSVNRLKLIKRQMYGRASFDLLRSRVLGLAQLSGRTRH